MGQSIKVKGVKVTRLTPFVSQLDYVHELVKVPVSVTWKNCEENSIGWHYAKITSIRVLSVVAT